MQKSCGLTKPIGAVSESGDSCCRTDDDNGDSQQPSGRFPNVMLSRKSVEVMKLLEAVKTQFVHMDEEVIKTQKKLKR